MNGTMPRVAGIVPMLRRRCSGGVKAERDPTRKPDAHVPPPTKYSGPCGHALECGSMPLGNPKGEPGARGLAAVWRHAPTPTADPRECKQEQ